MIYFQRVEKPISVMEVGCFAVIYLKKEAAYLKSCQQSSIYCGCIQLFYKRADSVVLLRQIDFTADKKRKDKRKKKRMILKY